MINQKSWKQIGFIIKDRRKNPEKLISKQKFVTPYSISLTNTYTML